MASPGSLFSVVGLAALLGGISMLFYQHAASSYMDEIFHVPQTQKYCKGHFGEWDHKITTFPGLYLFGTGYATALCPLLSTTLDQDTACTTTLLRSLNIWFGVACTTLYAAIHKELHPQLPRTVRREMAVALMLLPTHFFFHFLYYTDVGSVAFVMAAYLAALRRRYLLCALASAAATSFRQTNAVWAAFILAAAVLDHCMPVKGRAKQDGSLLGQLAHTLRMAWVHRYRLLRDLAPLAITPIAFAAFVVWNKGIVVGDRSAHAPVKHLMQPAYLLLFTAGALSPVHFAPHRLHEAGQQLAKRLFGAPLGTVLGLSSAATCMACLIRYYTVVHPYLLADNRHYTFYIWKDIMARHSAVRYALIPLYMYAAWSVWQSLRLQRSQLWLLTFGLATAATIVPAGLIEFRYFTIPFLLMALHMQPPTLMQLRAIIAIYAVVNIATIYMFLYRPFLWPDGSTARFLW